MLMHNYRDQNYIEIKKLVTLAIFISISIMLSILENLIPIFFVLPGIKLGLSNIVLLLIIPHYSFRSLLTYQFIRITVTTFIMGLFSTYMFSIIAGIVALILMYGAYSLFRGYITIYTISIIGAVTHNVTQLIVAMLYLQGFSITLYIFPLICAGVIMGFLIALIVDKKLNNIQRKLEDDSIKKLFG